MPSATYAGALAGIANGISNIGAAARATAADLTAAVAAAESYVAATQGASSSGGMSTNQGGNGAGVALGSTSSSSLGDPRNAADSAMRMNAAIQAAGRR